MSITSDSIPARLGISSGIQMMGVMKKRIRTMLATIGGTSRKRAETIPSMSAIQTPFRLSSRRPGTASRPFEPGHIAKRMATMTKIAAL